jgi:hypothetical protein
MPPGRRELALMFEEPHRRLPKTSAIARVDIVGAGRTIAEASDLARETGVDLDLSDHIEAAGHVSDALRRFLGAYGECTVLDTRVDRGTTAMVGIAHARRIGRETKDVPIARLAQTLGSVVSSARRDAGLAEQSGS